SISTWEDLTTRFLAQFFPPERTAKLRNDILMFQQHQRESLSKARTHFKNLLLKVPHHGIDRWLQIKIFYDHVSFQLKCQIDHAADGKLRDKNTDESWEIIKNLTLYDHDSWNDSKDSIKPVKAIFVSTNASKTPDRRLLELEDEINFLLNGPKPVPRSSSINVPQAYTKAISSNPLQTPGSGISILLAVGTPSTGSGNLYCQWELSPGSGNALCILFPTLLFETVVKTIRIDNGTELKNNELIELYRLKRIKREYSNARTPQQNGVAERKNRTVIKAARTMVYNLETKRVEENLHVNFLENKPNVARKGYAWMFDLDYLTNSMNYEPVTVENQANKSAGPKEDNNSVGTQANDDQGANLEEIDLNEKHFVMPIWSACSTTVKSLGDKIEKNSNFKTCEKPINQVGHIFLEELVKLKRQEKEANNVAESLRKEATHDIQNANTSSTNLLNTVSTPLSIIGPSREFNDGELSYPDDPLMPHLEDIYTSLSEGIFTDLSYDEVYQMDVMSAFLYGTIDEELYVSQPPGFVDPKFHIKVYKVVKALYGLHQAPRAWYATFLLSWRIVDIEKEL
nr:zinc finger, CCHC-type [Tanacetum cinerariifolium]